MESIIKEHERLATIEQDLRSIHRRLANLESLTESVHIIATEVKAMRGDVSDITARVEEIEQKPQKRYESVIAALIASVVGLLVGHFLNV